MNLFLADSLNISIQLLFAVLVIVSLLLLGVVLMQRPKQEGLGAAFGAAITDQAFGARTTDVLKKATVYFGTAFMVLCLGLGMPVEPGNDEGCRQAGSFHSRQDAGRTPAGGAAQARR